MKLALLIGGPVLLIILIAAGYFIFTGISQQQEENRQKVEGFGEMVIPADSQASSVATDPKLNPSIGRKNMTPTQRVIATLKQERESMLEEAITMREEIISLKSQVAELEDYKRTNERYAPHTFNEEVSTVHTRMKQLLATREESKRFNRNQLKGMAAAAAKEYRRFLTMHKLVLEQHQIDKVVNNHLPVYAYCIGDGIDVAANNRTEELLIVEYFKTDKTELMNNRLKSDLKAILTPCQELFANRMSFLTGQ
ncbi:hypothetical protein EHS89_06610 [Amphritea balenae]|uniref:Uncharacterized protein n=2 Tax=Amphritea balenae TaxID=452629 RepID=A0A3P1SRT5_9GAMM|nr:hypothetical protein EHS89_06610 [Amphritea balenae]GGK74875.1 hypothetical protein GCM10007941_26150 [Amphritea balenae]